MYNCRKGGYSDPLQYSCLENSMNRGTWWATVCRVARSQTQLKQLSMYIHPLFKLRFFSLSTIDILDLISLHWWRGVCWGSFLCIIEWLAAPLDTHSTLPHNLTTVSPGVSWEGGSLTLLGTTALKLSSLANRDPISQEGILGELNFIMNHQVKVK